MIKLIAEGLTSEEVGESLAIAKNTVDRHRDNILEKLGLRNRVDLTRYAIKRGLVRALVSAVAWQSATQNLRENDGIVVLGVVGGIDEGEGSLPGPATQLG